jgi:hypothetical protein
MRGQMNDHGFFTPLERTDLPFSTLWSGVTDDNMRQCGLGGLRSRDREIVRAMLACLLIASKVGQGVSTSRNKAHYGPHWRRYESEAYTYTRIVNGVSLLDCVGAVHHEKQKRGANGWQSRMYPTRHLREIFADWGPVSPIPGELIHLKNEVKVRIDYVDDDITRAKRRQLFAINEAIASITIGTRPEVLDFSCGAVRCGDSIVVPSRRSLYRVFNTSFELGGRLYGGFWQSMPAEMRQLLLLNSEPVAEHDYSQLHPQLLYALNGRRLDGDAYTISGYTRSIGKIAWMMLINSCSYAATINALRKEVQGSGLSSSFTPTDAEKVVKLLMERHAPVRSAFHSSVARTLQFIDSELMVFVLDQCLREGIVGLPVHDSLIVRTKDLPRAAEIMDDALQQTLKSLRDRA